MADGTTEGFEVEEVELWPAFGGKKKARTHSKGGKIYWMEIVDPNIKDPDKMVFINAPALVKLLRFLNGKEVMGLSGKIKVE